MRTICESRDESSYVENARTGKVIELASIIVAGRGMTKRPLELSNKMTPIAK